MGRSVVLALLAVSVLVASCAYIPHGDELRMCSDTPKNSLSAFMRGIADGSIWILRRLIPEDSSLTGVFGDGDEKRGGEIIRQIAASPEMKNSGGSCACHLVSLTDSGSDSQVKIALVERNEVDDDGHLYKYRRHFSVRFDLGNCISGVNSIDPKWERM